MNFYFQDFIEGLNDGLAKVAEEGSVFEMSGAIFPNISSQTKWQFARVGDQLHLNDGSNVYAFHLPEGEQEHDFPVTKITNNQHEFGKDATSKGTAQIHRADPGSIYFTLQDGSKNPTYTFKHSSGEQWRAIPKSKAHHHVQEIDKEAFMNGLIEMTEKHAGVLASLANGTFDNAKAGIRGMMDLGKDPLMSAGVGLLGGAAYDVGKRSLYNSKEENEAETTADRLKRYLIPSIAMGGIGALEHASFPNYYSEYPYHEPR